MSEVQQPTLKPAPTLKSASGTGWTTGLGNMLKKENWVWWGTRKWLIQTIVWTAIVTGLITILLYIMTVFQDEATKAASSIGESGIQLFFSLSAFVMVFGIIILTHDVILKERESGTAEWVLSKPLSRTAFVLSKLIASTIGITLIIVLLQGALSYAVISLYNGSPIALLSFAGGLALIWLACMFYLTMLLFLGTLTTSRGVVLGAPIGFYLLGSIVPMIVKESVYVMPWKLGDIAAVIALGSALPVEMLLPVGATVVWIVIFLAGALWRIEKLEI